MLAWRTVISATQKVDPSPVPCLTLKNYNHSNPHSPYSTNLIILAFGCYSSQEGLTTLFRLLWFLSGLTQLRLASNSQDFCLSLLPRCWGYRVWITSTDHQELESRLRNSYMAVDGSKVQKSDHCWSIGRKEPLKVVLQGTKNPRSRDCPADQSRDSTRLLWRRQPGNAATEPGTNQVLTWLEVVQFPFSSHGKRTSRP